MYRSKEGISGFGRTDGRTDGQSENIMPLALKGGGIKKALRIITGVHPRSPSGPLFCQLKFLNCENIFKYLVGRLM